MLRAPLLRNTGNAHLAIRIEQRKADYSENEATVRPRGVESSPLVRKMEARGVTISASSKALDM
jgi:hypothetical protein